MMIELCPVEGVRTAGEGIYVLSFTSASVSRSIRAGQFLNLRVEDGCEPLLRRPFSAYRIEKTSIEIVFHVVGRGTAALRRKRQGDVLDVHVDGVSEKDQPAADAEIPEGQRNDATSHHLALE